MDKKDPKHDDVLAWLESTGKGPIAAVRHFWDPDAKVKTHRREYAMVYAWQSTERNRRKPRKPVKGSKTADPVGIAEPVSTGDALHDLDAEIAHTRQIRAAMAADHSWSAWAMVSRYLRQLEEAAHASRVNRATDFDPHDDEQIVAAVLALPRRILDDPRIRAALARA